MPGCEGAIIRREGGVEQGNGGGIEFHRMPWRMIRRSIQSSPTQRNQRFGVGNMCFSIFWAQSDANHRAAGCCRRQSGVPENGHGGLSSRTSALRQLGCARVVPTLDNLSLFLGSWLEAPLPDWISESALLSTAFSNQTLRFSTEVLPRLATSSYSTVCPSLRVERPAFSTAEI